MSQALEERGAFCALPDLSDDPAEAWADLRRNLRECDALMVIYGLGFAAGVMTPPGKTGGGR